METDASYAYRTLLTRATGFESYFGELSDSTRTLRFDPETDFARWAATIARFEVLNYRRSKARDRLVFDEGIVTACEAATARIFSVDQTVQSVLQHIVDRQQDW